jgi:hypothetical protein
MYLSLEVVMVH